MVPSKSDVTFMKKSLSYFYVFFLLLSLSEYSAACDLITLYYHDRIPHSQRTENGIEGLIASPSALAFEMAGIPFQWKKTPPKRQIKIIEDNEGCDCAVGWFKNPEREKFAKFTLHLYQDRPYIAIVRADNKKLQSGITIDAALSNSKITLAIKDGYSYGAFLDTKIAMYKPVAERTSTNNINMLKKIHAGRNDYFFIAPEEADCLIESSGFPKKDFKYITFSDIPEGEKRYIMCSQKVEDEIIKKLNHAIQKYVLEN